ARDISQAQRVPFRRRLMSGSIIGVGIIGAIIGGAVLSQSGPSPADVSVFHPKPQAHLERLDGVTVNSANSVSYQDLLDYLGKALNVPVVVRWKAIGEVDGEIAPSKIVPFAVSNLSAREALSLLSEESTCPRDDQVDWRLQDGKLTIATTSYFDKVETTLV